METARRHALENYEKDLKTVQVLEVKLGIMQRWQSNSLEWQNAGKMVAMRKYQRALDTLEGLIVARMFELTKMNRSQTGEYYPLCAFQYGNRLYRLCLAKTYRQGASSTFVSHSHGLR
jgi:hypothetical protein